MKRSVRWFGWWGALLGGIVVICGAAAPFVPLTAVGLVLAGAGLWTVCRPSVTGLIVHGVTMIVTGAFLCLLWLWVDAASPSSIGKWIFAGLVQIVWGIRRLATYPTARFAARDAQAMARLESMVGELSKRDARADRAIVEFSTGRWPWHRNRLGLYADGTIGLLAGRAVRLEKRSDVWIEARGTAWHGRSLTVGIQMSDLQLTGHMSPEHLERFERWKLGSSSRRSIAA